MKQFPTSSIIFPYLQGFRNWRANVRIAGSNLVWGWGAEDTTIRRGFSCGKPTAINHPYKMWSHVES